jgi:hypothetical protein
MCFRGGRGFSLQHLYDNFVGTDLTRDRGLKLETKLRIPSAPTRLRWPKWGRADSSLLVGAENWGLRRLCWSSGVLGVSDWELALDGPEPGDTPKKDTEIWQAICLFCYDTLIFNGMI